MTEFDKIRNSTLEECAVYHDQQAVLCEEDIPEFGDKAAVLLGAHKSAALTFRAMKRGLDKPAPPSVHR